MYISLLFVLKSLKLGTETGNIMTYIIFKIGNFYFEQIICTASFNFSFQIKKKKTLECLCINKK